MRKLLVAAVISSVLLLIPFSSQAQANNAELTGTVAYRERMALPPDAVINVQLLDTSIADIAAQTVSDVMINAEGRQVPVPFTLAYDPAKIVPGNRYSVRATIRSGDGMLMFSSTQAYPVLTHGAPSKVNLILYRVGHGAKPAAAKKPAAAAASEDAASNSQPVPSASESVPANSATPAASEAAPSAPPPTAAEPEKPAVPAEASPAPTDTTAAERTPPQPTESSATAPNDSTPSETAPSPPPAEEQQAPPVESHAATATETPSAQTEPTSPAKELATTPEQAAPPENKTEAAAPASDAKPNLPEAPLPEAPSASKGMESPPTAPGEGSESSSDAESSSRPERATPATALTVLANTQWKLVQLNGQDVVVASTQKPVTLAFSPEGRRIAGSAGCNSFLGTYSEEHGVLHMSPGNMTMMFCPDPAGSREKKFIAMLRAVDGYRLNGDFLTLTSNGKTVAKFKTNPPL